MAARRPGLVLWADQDAPTERPPMPGGTDADVAVVGAGFTGLWTAWHLAQADPSLRVVVVEQESAGFGASGRNGGWCSALFPVPPDRLDHLCGPGSAAAMRRALRGAVDDVGAFCAAEVPDARFVRAGSLSLARTPAQEARLRKELAVESRHGFPVSWLPPAAVAERVHAGGVRGALYDEDCAALHPGRLVRGLAAAVERAGVTIYERTRATRVSPGLVETARGRLRAEYVVRATEAWTPQLPGHRRALAPVYSLVVATEPLPAGVWDELGWAGRETLTDGRHLLVYAQRTADDRIVLGGRGAPYHLGSAVRPAYDTERRVFQALHRTLGALLPAAAGARLTHAWGGPLGVPRDWFPSVGLDRATGLGWAGGYVGDGVAASRLAGATLADLVLRRDTERTRLAWVGHSNRRWEPEPLRWAGINAGRLLATAADRGEATGGRSPLTPLLRRLVGG